MKIRPLSIAGGYEITPAQHEDARGTFLEWYRAEELQAAVGNDLRLAQANLSRSAAGVVRGVHFADVPPGQAKYVTAVRGRLLDVVVDIRVGSPTFGAWESVELDEYSRRAVYLSEGLGHAVCALEDDATVVYLCSTGYNPSAEHAINPLDPDLAITWPVRRPLLSPRDAAAPTLAQAIAAGMLPVWQECCSYTESLTIRAST